MRWSERRTAVRSTFEDDFHTSTPSDARSRPPSLILVSLDALRHVTSMNIVYIPTFYIVLWLAMTGAGILLFRRFGGAATLLLVIGAIGYTVSQVVDACIGYRWIPFEVVARHSALVNAVDRAARLTAICFTVGFVWFAIKATRSTNRQA